MASSVSHLTVAESGNDWIAPLRRIVADLFQANGRIYWLDTFLTMVVAYTASLNAIFAPLFSWPQIVGFIVAGPALYRLISFSHDIVHMRRGKHVAYKVLWNVLVGIPLFVPTYLYENHIAHHNTRWYGTSHDAEYLPLGTNPLRFLAKYTLQILFVPLLVVFRFGVLVPLSLFHPPLRRWMLRYLSAFGIQLYYRREVPDDAPLGLWKLIDVAVMLRLSMVPLACFVLELYPPNRILLMYLLAVYGLSLNWMRNLTAHRFSGDGKPMSLDAQLHDSVNVTGNPISTELICPLGLRYHALHHLFPALPYHNLGKAHRRLMAQLPANSPYHDTIRPTLWSAFIALYRAAKAQHESNVKSWATRAQANH